MLDGGFDSGFIVIPAGLTSGFPTFNLTITNASIREFFSWCEVVGWDLRTFNAAFDSYLGSLQAVGTRSSLLSWHGCVSETVLHVFLDVPCFPVAST
jgi:hypothetical protein